VWIYKPPQHKTEHLGKTRVVAIGAKGQAILRDFLTMDTQAYLFSPVKAMEERSVILRGRRKTNVQPSQQYEVRRAKRRKRPPGDRYNARSFAKAIARGCEQADSKQREDAIKTAELAGVDPPGEDVVFVPRWGPNRLRHNFATLVRKQLGLEAAQVALGHSKADVTQIYAEKNLELAGVVARKIG
jgi:integrase